MRICLAASLAASVSFAAPDGKKQADAQLLDHAEFLCANCFFGPSDYYYCFAADNQILVAYQRTPVLNWQDKSKNYLTSVRQGWEAWSAPGQTVPIRYDDRHIWVTRPEGQAARHGFWAHFAHLTGWASHGNGKQVKLRRSSVRDMFVHNDRCRASAGQKAD